MRSVIIVTGASSSLGIVLCQQLVRRGYFVYAGYNSNSKGLKKDKFLKPIKLDITDPRQSQKAITGIFKKEKSVFALINLVAIAPNGQSLKFEPKDFQNILDVNTVGHFRLIKLVLPHLPTSGRIINIGSLSGLISFPGFSLYSASKFALRALSLSLYYECLPKKRYVVHIAPGAIGKSPSVPPPKGSARQRIPLLNWLLPLTTPQKVCQKIIHCLETPTPPPEILIGVDTVILTLLNRLLPGFVWIYLQKFVWKKQH